MDQIPEAPSSQAGWIARHKRLVITGLVALLLIVVVFFIATFYVRSGRLNRYIIGEVQTALTGYGLRAEVGDLELVWGIRTAKVHDVKIYNQETGQLVATLDSAEVVVEIPNPFALRLQREIIFKRLDLKNLQAYVAFDEQGVSNFIGLHTPPPAAPSRITFDFSNLVASIDGGTLHLDDRARRITADLGKLKANAQPIAGQAVINLQFNADEGQLRYEGRDTTLESLGLTAQVGDAGAAIEQLVFRSPLGEIAAKGRVDNWQTPRYNFDIQAQVNLDETERVFVPDIGLQGKATFNGTVNGEAAHYRINGRATSDELVASDATVRGASVEEIYVESDEGRLTFSSGAAQADAIDALGNHLLDVRVSGLSGDYTKGVTQANVPQLNVARVALSQGHIAGLALRNLTARLENGRTQARVQQVTARSLALAQGELSDIVLQHLVTNTQNGRTQAQAQQVKAARLNLKQGEISGINVNQVTATLQGQRYQVTGGLTINGGQVSGAQLGQANGKLVADNTTVTLNQFTAAVLGGTASGDVSVQISGNGASRLAAKLTEVKTAALFSLMAVTHNPLTGTVNGEVNVNWPGTNFEAISGDLNAHLTGATTQTESAIPVNGEVAIKAQSGTFQVEQLTLATPASQVVATGTLSSKGDSDLQFTLTSTNAAELQTIAYSVNAVKEALADFQPHLADPFNFQGRVTGKLSDPTIEGDVQAASLGLREETLGSLTGHVLVSPTQVAFENGVLAMRDGGTAKVNYSAPRATLATEGRLDATLDRVNVEALTAAMGLSNQQFISGRLSGEAHLTGLPNAPNGTATVNLLEGTVAGQPAQVATANLLFDGRTARLEHSEIRLAQGQLMANGTYDLKSKAFQLQGNADKVDLGQLVASLKVTTTVNGTANATFQANGNTNDIGDLNLELKAQGQNVTINGRDAGQLSLTAHTNPGGRLDIDLLTGITGKPQPLRASVELRRPGKPLTVDANLADFDLAPLVAAFAPDLASAIAGAVNGRLHIAGPLVNDKDELTPDGLRGDLTLNNIALQVRGRAIAIQTPFTVALNGAQLTLSQTRISGQGIDLRLGGTLGLKEGAGLNFALNGTATLDSLGQFNPDLFLGGTLAIDARLTGTFNKPELGGEIQAKNLSFTGIDLPVSIEEGNGRLVFAGDKVTLENFTARANEGNFTASGSATLAQLQPQEWQFVANANNVDILYQGMQAVVNGDFTLRGTPDRQVLGGTLNIPEGEYTTNLDLSGLTAGGGAGAGTLSFGGGGGAPGSAGGFLNLPPLSLDLHIEAPGTLLVRNQQINTVASAALAVGGTFNDPSVTGRVSVEGGTIKLRSQRYDITTGTLDFPIGGDTPLINIATEGEVSGYHVYLGLEGPIDAMEVNLRSDPDLPRSEILSLVATGKTDSSTLGSQDILASGLGTAASLLSEEFISQPAQSLLGLNRFQIDPVLQPNANPAARLTIGKQLTRDLAFTYSTNVGSEQDQSVILEYTLTNRFSGIASYTQGGTVINGARTNSDFTIEMRGRRRFSLGYVQVTANAVGTTNAGAGSVPPRRERTPKPAAEVALNKPDELKLSEKKLRELLPVEVAGFSRPLARLGERNLTNYLQERGYFFAAVRSRCEPADCRGTNIKVFYDVSPGPRYDLDDIRIEGTDLLDVADVAPKLQSKKASFFGGVPIVKNLPLVGGLARGITSDDRIRRDRETIRSYMADLGFRSARVSHRIETKPQREDLVLVFTVEPGARSTVAQVFFKGNSVVSSDELRRAIPIQVNKPFSPTEVRDGNRLIKRLYADKGYLEATTQYRVVDMDTDRVGLVYEINEGSRALVADINIEGETKTREAAIRRFFAFKPGDLLTPAKIRRTQRDLFATGAFSEVNIQAQAVNPQEPEARQVTVHLTEAKPLLMIYGIGYSSDEGPRGLLQFTNTNLFGQVNSLSLRMRASFREQLVQLQYIDPRIFGSQWGATVSAFYDRNSNLQTFLQRRLVTGGRTANSGPGFGINRFVAFLQAERKFSDITSMRLRYSIEHTRLFNVQNIPVEEIARNAQAVRLGQFSAGFTHDTRDSALNPTKGQLISFDHSLAARPFGGNEAFNKFYLNYQHYTQLARQTPVLRDSVLAFAGRLGLAAPYAIRGSGAGGAITASDRLLPLSARFFSGGATTLRGFQFEQAGPQAILEPRNAKELPTLVPLGGDGLVVLNFELRYPLTTQLRLVPFYDLGNVFRKVSDIQFNNMTHSIGLGLRLNTPIGPIGIDYGYLLNPPSFTSATGLIIRQPQGVIHIRFGQTF
ncbi:MAG: outer membrane protein assembly factor BamA [Acidobacteria bacterium]|nr:outer membrane protein assembly factor BamA [Acidobacteriota bacterium]